MGMRYNNTGAFMPAGLVAGMSAGMSVFYIWLQTKPPPKKVTKKRME
jgi:hypothetical protein